MSLHKWRTNASKQSTPPLRTRNHWKAAHLAAGGKEGLLGRRPEQQINLVFFLFPQVTRQHIHTFYTPLITRGHCGYMNALIHTKPAVGGAKGRGGTQCLMLRYCFLFWRILPYCIQTGGGGGFSHWKTVYQEGKRKQRIKDPRRMQDVWTIVPRVYQKHRRHENDIRIA